MVCIHIEQEHYKLTSTEAAPLQRHAYIHQFSYKLKWLRSEAKRDVSPFKILEKLVYFQQYVANANTDTQMLLYNSQHCICIEQW